MEMHLFDLPKEIIQLVMTLMRGDDLFLFSMVNKLTYALSDDEDMWKSVYSLDLPKSYYALVVVPYADNWSFKNNGSRLMLYLLINEKEKIKKSEIETIMEVMGKKINSVLIQKASAYLIRRLAYRPPGCTTMYNDEVFQNKKIFGKSNALKYLLHGLQNFNNAELADNLLCALTNLAVDRNNCAEIVDSGGIDIILDTLKLWQNEFFVVEKACSCLANIARESEKCKSIATNGGVIEIAINTLTHEKSNAEEKRHALNLLIVLSKKDVALRLRLGEAIFPAVAALFQKYDEKQRIFLYLCEAIQRFCKCLESNQQTARRLKIDLYLYEAFERCKCPNALYEIQFALFYMLPKISLSEDEAHKFLKLTIDKMREFPDAGNFLMGASFVLTDFAQTHLNFINSLQGGKLVKEALKNFTDNPSEFQMLIEEYGW